MRKRRIAPVFAVLMVGFALVSTRLVKLQALESEMWLRESERSTASFRSLPFERGWIMDRRGRPLARTEEVLDLTFRYRGWRRGTVAGQACHAWVLLGLSRNSVPEAVAQAEKLSAALGDVRIDEIAALSSRQRRRDLGFYLERLFGEEIWDEIANRLQGERTAAVRLADLDGFDRMLTRVLARVKREREALHSLAKVAGLRSDQLMADMERAAARADDRVQVGLAKEAGDERELYRREQELHGEFDADPTRLARRVSYDTRTLVAIRQGELGGFGIHMEMRRIYPEGVRDVAPGIVGHVGSPQPEDRDRAFEHRLRLSDLSSLTALSPEELDELERLRIQVREVDYLLSEERGRLGVEAAFEDLLRGKRGWIATREQVESDSVEREQPQRGLNVVLTLDTDLQRACEEVLDQVFTRALDVRNDEGDVIEGLPAQWAGAIVLMDPNTGEILALATGPRPSRDDYEQRRYWLDHEDSWKRIRHRAVDPGRSGDLPPAGSTFKPVSALAGLVTPGTSITRGTRFLCEGSLEVGDRSIGCLGYHGEIGLEEALARSCNIYFYRLGRAVGIEALREMALRFGFGSGRRSGLFLGNEVLESLGVPMRSGFHEARPVLGPGDSVSDAMRLAIGQAPLDDVTPLQIATMMGAVGTGTLRPPSLVAELEGYPPIPARGGRSLGIPEGSLAVVRDGMAAVMDSEMGTGRRLNEQLKESAPWLVGKIAAKTGTAQVGGHQDQSWFAGYLPRDTPRLAFAVLIEDCGLHGSEAAAPTFGLLLEKPVMQSFLAEEILTPPGGRR
ncbi:MAG: penicillin-binding transpeptidase domain-containing protein [Planctomycetota bacterium]|nr:penicillin-binding transpeptidase domain-containing protein [Planctomycetota bacterium]